MSDSRPDGSSRKPEEFSSLAPYFVASRSTPMRNLSIGFSLLAPILLHLGCGKDPPAPPNTTPSATSPAVASVAPPAAPRGPLKAPERSGGALVRSADGARLYLADEDHKTLRVLPLPFGPEPKQFEPDKPRDTAPPPSAPPPPPPSASAMASASASSQPSAPPSASAVPPHPPPPNAKQIEIAMPGAPAQVLSVDGFVLATVRDPGLLVVFKEEPGDGLKEQAKIELPADAWGIALTPDEKTVIVSSAWTHKVSAVDWRAGKVLWTQNVMREPRGIVIHPDGKSAYVSHLTSGDLTKFEGLDGATPKSKKIVFPAAPMRTPYGTSVEGALGYSLVIDDAGNRVLAARHAVGGLASWSDWYGLMSIDVLQTQNDKPLLKPRVPGKKIKGTVAFEESIAVMEKDAHGQDLSNTPYKTARLQDQIMPQPRAMIISHKNKSVWLASEGDDSIAEFPLFAAAPAERTLRSISVGNHYKDPKIIGNGYADADGIPSDCGAPSGLALSADETLLYVFCRSTYDIATLRIAPPPELADKVSPGGIAGLVYARVATETDEAMARGRKLFYGARDGYSSGGLGCAGCHPEGRDDGHVWHEIWLEDFGRKRANFLATQYLAEKTKDGKLGYPRQTPMLAGRLNSKGPYGWHAQSEGLLERLAEGFMLHRWNGFPVDPKSWMLGERVNALTVFLRKGLVPPPRITRELTAQEKKGKQIFESPETACVQCHTVETEFTNRMAMPLPKLDSPAGFEDEENLAFKVPSLLYVGGTAPYYHDGSVPTLETLISRNNDRMGKTNQLSADQRAALVAYLETL